MINYVIQGSRFLFDPGLQSKHMDIKIKIFVSKIQNSILIIKNLQTIVFTFDLYYKTSVIPYDIL